MVKQLMLSATLFLSVVLLNAQDFYDLSKITEVEIQLDYNHWDVVLDSLKELGHDDRVLGSTKTKRWNYSSSKALL